MTEITGSPAYSGQTTLYVIFHGLWAFETRVDKILARTCIEEEHEIVAGPGMQALLPGHCRLINTGQQPRTTNQFHDDVNVIVTNKKFALPSKQFCVIELPLPRHIESLRSTQPDNPPEIPFGGVDGEKLRPEEVSMVQILFYTVPDPSKVQLVPPGITPVYDQPTDTAKLHIFAETPCRMTDIPGLLHVRDAYTKLALLFNLDIVPLAAAFTPPFDPNLPGLSFQDLMNLDEMMMGLQNLDDTKEKLMADSGSNCDPLIIDNTGLWDSDPKE
jgi:hypothetical protein